MAPIFYTSNKKSGLIYKPPEQRVQPITRILKFSQSNHPLTQ
jgi:hypothetical protein